MMHHRICRNFSAGAVALAFMIWPDPAPADTFYETVYLPTSSVVTVPGSSLLTTSYVMPTSSMGTYLPSTYTSSYLPTSAYYSADSMVVPTSTTYYRRSLLRPRRFVERTSYSSYYTPTSYVTRSSLMPTSYVLPSSYVMPTSYLLPTTYVTSSTVLPMSTVIDNGVVTTSGSYPCDTTTYLPSPSMGASRSSSGNTGPGIISVPRNTDNSPERKPSATINASPSSEEPVPAPVTTPPPPPRAAGNQPPNTMPDPAVDPASLPNLGPGVGTGAGAGTVPNEPIQFPRPGSGGAQPPNETFYRNVKRPTYDFRNILRGRVISAETRQPVESVTIVVVSQTGVFADKTAMTDAFGEFKVSLPDGDWFVKVTMPSGSVRVVGRDAITASNGRITDVAGRAVSEYLINR